MSVDLHQLVDARATTKMNYLGHEARLVYDPNVLTGENIMRTDTETNPQDLFEFLATVILDWDVNRGGEKVPCTPEGFASVPLPLVKAAMKAVLEDTGDASGESGKDSNDG